MLVDPLDATVADNEIIVARTKGVGILPAEVAVAYGVSGPNLRASGVGFDLRKVEDYLPYHLFDFEIPTGENGDCWDRWHVRLLEIRQSVRIVQQAIDGIPSGPLQAKVPKVIKVPQGVQVERRPRMHQSADSTTPPEPERTAAAVPGASSGHTAATSSAPSHSTAAVLPARSNSVRRRSRSLSPQ